MADPITLAALTVYIIKNAPSWLTSLRSTVLDKSWEVATNKGKDFAVTRGESFVHRIFQLDDKEQLRHLEQALKNATERGLATFDTLLERDRYKEILHTLSLPGPLGEVLRKETMQLFTLSETPDLTTLSNIYNERQRFHNAEHQDIDAAPYLNSFFTALIGELYADPYFRQQLSDVLQLRASTSTQKSLLDIIDTFKRIGETLEDNYSPEEFARDVDIYTAHIERTLHSLKVVGVVPKDRTADPDLDGIFVPLRTALREPISSNDQQLDTIVTTLEQHPCLVLLGGPGSGKSTVTRYLAWSHAAKNQSPNILAHTLLLSGSPLPLRIELRRLNEERKRTNYDFLSFATEVLLKREGIEINAKMFKELLTRRCMLLLFDGLDEVTTLDERLELVNEIEHFALCYPGNRVLVTSRPVGYDLASISHPLFSHAEVQNFNDEQIKQFLENWYTAVLRISPLQQQDQEELDLLLDTLKENLRLHKLAENPLLLTVITVLHRYERLPDRRVLVYDRCANLLLETWAMVRGTDTRWKDMKLVKEDQYACIAYLGFILHDRSQEETLDEDESVKNTTVDVNSRFLQRNVEDFLRKQKLIAERAEQRAEAKRFIALVQEEAGLIVERGIDENDDKLYSFVHLTFQEYFAAADIYERYQQKEDPKIISKFLAEHLHDPHWREVVLLLLGKLKSMPVTNQLRQILQGKLKSRRSQFTDIVQQDLFFVCDCLIDEIKVESTLVEMVISRLSGVVKNSLFLRQQQEALQYFGKLMKTRQYAGQGREELIAFAKNESLTILTRLEAIKNIYMNSLNLSEENLLAVKMLMDLLQCPELSVEQVWHSAEFLYWGNRERQEAGQLAVKILMGLLQRLDLSVDQIRQIAESLYHWSSRKSEAEQLATSRLTSLLKYPDLSVDQVRRIAESLYLNSPKESEAEQLATSRLISLFDRPDLTVDQTWQVALSLYKCSPEGSEAEQLAASRLTALLQRPDLSAGQVWQSVESFSLMGPVGSKTWQLATSVLTSLFGHLDLTVDQTWKVALSLYHRSPEGSEAEQLATSRLTSLLDHSDFSVDLLWQDDQFQPSYKKRFKEPKIEQLATFILTSLLERPDLTVDQIRQIALSLYDENPEGSETQILATSILLTLISFVGIPDNQDEELQIEVYGALRKMVPQFHKLVPIKAYAWVQHIKA